MRRPAPRASTPDHASAELCDNVSRANAAAYDVTRLVDNGGVGGGERDHGERELAVARADLAVAALVLEARQKARLAADGERLADEDARDLAQRLIDEELAELEGEEGK